MIPTKSSLVHQRIDSRLLTGAGEFIVGPTMFSGVGPVCVVQGLVSTLHVPSERDAYTLLGDPALPSMRECQRAFL